MPEDAKPADIASMSVADTLATLHVSIDAGLTEAEVDVRCKEQCFDEVAETKGHAATPITDSWVAVQGYAP